MFAGIDMFLARLRVVLLFIVPYSVVLTMELFTILCKVALRMAQNIFMPKNVNCINIIITLEGVEKIQETEKKNDNKPVGSITRACEQIGPRNAPQCSAK